MVDASLLGAVALILALAKVCGGLFERIGLPAVLGELTAGILLGNLDLVGAGGLDWIAGDSQLAVLGEIGVLLLLFQVGLESNLAQMARVGAAAFAVACVGVILPAGLGYGLHAVLEPGAGWHAHLFIGAVLTATSVGITARVLADLKQIDSPTGRVVLGAAVIDDVLGLIVLAVVSGLVAGDRGEGGGLDGVGIALLLVKAFGFLGVAIALGPLVSRRLYRAASALRVRRVLLAASLAFCFAVSWLADLVELAPIVGAFAAGLVLDDVVYRDLDREDHDLTEQLRPLGEMLTPIFFVLTGAAVDLSALGDTDVALLAGALIVAAVAGKQACALVAFGPGIHRRSVGIGMIPRGEVGLIFAASGMKLGVIDGNAYAAIVIMVMFTTLMTPPLLAWSLGKVPA